MNQVPKKTDHVLFTSKAMVFEPDHETLIKLKSPVLFSKGLIEANGGLPDGLHVMDGITEPDEDGMIGVIVANFSHLNVKMPSKTAIAKLSTHPGLLITPLTECLSVASEKPKIIDSSHVRTVGLQSVPPRYRPHYERLLVSFADIFSKNDLDIGHCRSLLHHVRLKDSNRLTAINQYRLPFHLKSVAIDYVQKLLAAGVVRKSTSVFNSPLMLVKKPHADPKKPLAEQYRLVHNYVDLNKNIAPCSYPLRHLYELLDEVAGGSVYSVLDLSQGFFQQHLIDPLEATSFSLPGFGQYTYCRSPQGLNSSPAYFQRLLDSLYYKVLRECMFTLTMWLSQLKHMKRT